jgi:hypothetical protein
MQQIWRGFNKIWKVTLPLLMVMMGGMLGLLIMQSRGITCMRMLLNLSYGHPWAHYSGGY